MRFTLSFVATVVGALLVGGATTGTTLALWRAQAIVDRGQIGSGSISVTLNGSTNVSFGNLTGLAVNNGATPGVAQSLTGTLVNASPTASKNLKMQLHLDAVTSTPELTSGLEVAASTVATGATCPSTALIYKPLSGYTSTALTSVSLAPDGSRRLCVDVRVKANAPADVAGKSGDLTFTFRGEQVRS